MLSRPEADAALAGFGATHDRMAAALYALDQHPGLLLLRGGLVTGQTADRWRTLAPEIDRVWAHFTVLGSILEQARAVRGRRRLEERDWTELARLLRDPVVGLGGDGMPVDDAATAKSHLAIEDLARQLEQRVVAVSGVLSDVDSSWTAVAAGLARVSAGVDGLVATADQLALGPVVDPLRAAIGEVERLDLRDPLAAAPAGRLTRAAQARLDGIATVTQRIGQELAALVGLRDGYRQRRASLANLLDEVAAAEGRLSAIHQRVAQKIANPGLGTVPAAAAVLRPRLAGLDRLALDATSTGGSATDGSAARWRRLATELSSMESSAARARDRTVELIGVAEGLLARRDELRGRLEAYRAKAAACGLAEHAELSSRHAHAHDLLFAAPCDLRASTRAVHEYQQGLASVLGSGERSAVDARED